MLAQVTWIGGSGDWSSGLNWSNGTGPGPADDAVIDVAGVSITHSSGAHRIQSLTINDPVTLSGGTLTVTGTLEQQNANTVTMTGGTLRGATVVGEGGAVLVASGGTLDGVTLGGAIGGVPTAATVQSSNPFTVTGGLTFANGSLVDLGNQMLLSGDQPLGGDGEIRLRGGSGSIADVGQATFGSGLTIHRADTSSSTIAIGNGGSITNLGTIRADAGGEIRVFSNLGAASFTNAAGGVLAADGGTLSLATDWSNAGQIVVNDSTLNLGGSFTTDGIGPITRTGGTINLAGLLDNTGRVFTLDAATGSWNLDAHGTLFRGSLVTSDGAVLVAGTAAGPGGTFDGVALGATVGGVAKSATVQGNGAVFFVINGLTFANGSLLDLGNGMIVAGDQFWSGDGEIRFRGPAAGITNFNQTVFGPGLTIHRSDSARSDINLVGGSLTNLATLRADAGGEIRVTGNPGTTFTNAVSGVLSADGGTLSLLTSWSNTGQIVVNDSTLNLGGSFTTDGIGPITRTAGTINLVGLLDNTGRTLVLDHITGSWNLDTGGPELRGGNLVTSQGAALVVRHDSGKLNGITLGGSVGGVPVSGNVQAVTGFTVTGGLTFANGSILDLNTGVLLVGDQTLGGDGEIRLLGGAVGIRNFNQTTIGPGLTIQAFQGSLGNIFQVDGSITNHGTIRADRGSEIRVQGNAWTTFTNAAEGVVTADGGTLLIDSTTNLIAGTLTGGTWQALGGGTLRITGADISTNAATITLDGVGARFTRDSIGTNALANLAANAAGGNLTVRNGANLSTPGSFTNNGSLTLGLASTLSVGGNYLTAGDTTIDGSLVAGIVTVAQTGTLAGSGTVAANLVNNGQVRPGMSPGTLTVNGSYAQGGTGRLDIELGGTSAGSQYDVLRVSGTATLDGTLAVRLVNGFGPAIGQVFEVMTFAGHAGAFRTVTGLSQGRFPLFNLAVNAANVELNALANGTDLAFDSFPAATFPADAEPGQVVSLTYTVQNRSEPPAEGSWVDSVYLSRDGVLDPSDALLTRVEHHGDVAGLGSYTETATAPLPALAEGSYRVIVVADSRGLISDGDRGNNTGVSTQALRVTVPILTLGTPVNGNLAPGQDRYFRVLVAPGVEVTVAADFAALPGAEVAVRYAAPPDQTNQDDATPAGQLHSRLLLSNTRGGTYYVRLHTTEDAAGSVAFTLAAAVSGFEITSFSPLKGSNQFVAPALITVQGANFTPQSQVLLRPAIGAPRAAQSVKFLSANTLVASVDLVDLPTGAYKVVVQDAGRDAVAFDAFTVTNNDGGRTGVGISVLSFVRVGGPIKIILYEGNSSDSPLPAPLVEIRATDVYDPGRDDVTGSLTPGIHTGYFPGSYSQKFDPFKIYGTSRVPGTSTFSLSIVDPSQTPMNWDNQKATLRPDTIPPDVWDAVWDNLRPQLGDTLSDFAQFLISTGEKLLEAGAGPVEGIDRLFGFELQKANNMPAVPVPATAVDVAFPAPGLPLVFGRVLGETLAGRSHLGRLGRGWSDAFDISLTESATTGTVTLRRGSALRFFGRQPDGSYETLPGYTSVLSKVNGLFQLREATGEVTAFRADGLLDYLQDANGNRITAGYNANNQLISLTHSGGGALTLAYNGQGRIRQVTDPAGGVATYEYDASGEHLLRVISPEGTTVYTYSAEATGPRAHALTSITSPAGTHLFFDYDGHGRLARQQGDGGAETLGFAYDTASFRVTNADGQVTTFFYDDSFRIRKVRDPLGRLSYVDYDASNNPVVQGTVGGGEANFEYDAQGNATLARNPIGETQAFAYEPGHGRLTNWEDALGHVTQFANDANGNLLATTQADGSTAQYSYDAQGNVVAAVNRLGQTIQYTYDGRGQVIRKELPGGASVDYSYNARGKLETVTDASGMMRFEYLDPQNPDLVTKVTYPNGRFLEYTYENNRRIRMVDQSGFAVNYLYDAAGRLDVLRDGGNGLIVDYDYDPVGQLARETRGNGTVTDYAYDAAGQLLSILHRAPDGSVQSQFVYAYDTLGRRTSVTTMEGVTTYGYDGAGRLTSVTLPGGRVLTYAYDAAGNRTEVGDNSANMTYTVNDLNQYVALGSTSQAFDAAGNLAFSSGPAGRTTYRYDAEGRLVSQVTPTGTWTYEYDALGNRVASTHDGVRTQFLVDPSGLGNVVGEYDGAGNLVAHYTRGLGLASRVDAGGQAAYYEFDAAGNTADLTGLGGAVLNTYSYLPFGEALSVSETVANPFEFVGQLGVMREGNGLDFMRNRWYDPAQGRFTQQDPIGLAGGPNFYAYVGNNPVNLVDPSGLGPEDFISTEDASQAAAVIQAAEAKLGELNAYYGAFYQLARSQAIASGVQEVRETAGVLAAQTQAWINWVNSNRAAVTGGGAATLRAGYYSVAAVQRAVLLTKLGRFGAYGFIAAGAALIAFEVFYLGEMAAEAAFDLPNPDCIPIAPDVLQPGCVAPAIPGGGKPVQTVSAIRSNSRDPNDIVGTAGFGAPGFVVPQATLPYRIDFQNDPDAGASAAEVVVTHVLDADLDLDTFQLDEFGFGDLTVPVPAGRQSYSTRLDLRSTRGVFADVAARLDRVTRTVTWRFQAIDPETMDLPVSPFVGLLPPDKTAPEGEGFVSFSVRPKAGVPTGTRIDAMATIVFDTNAPIDTNGWTNTIDDGPPTSLVNALPATTTTPSFTVSWSGGDEAGLGSGIATFDVFVSDNGGPFLPFLQGTTQTSVTFTGIEGHTYGFYSVATDNLGHIEPTPAAAQATIRVVAPLAVAAIEPVVPSPRHTPVSTIDVTFSAPIDLSTFTPSDLTLTINGGPNLITGAVTIASSASSDSAYQIGGLSGLTQSEGRYTLTVKAAGIEDRNGNFGSGSLSTSWLMDTTLPTSHVNPLPKRGNSLTFAVSASGADRGAVPSGVGSYDVYSSISGGPWTFWTSIPASNPTATFTGQSNTTYAFYSTAHDLAGNAEVKRPIIEASTYLPDLTPPVTSVTGTTGTNPSTVNTATGTFTLNLTGGDTGGGGLAYLEVFVAIDAQPPGQIGPAIPVGAPDAQGLDHATLTYQGLADGVTHQYRFFSIGIDAAGNIEAAHGSTGDVLFSEVFTPPGQLELTGFSVQHGSPSRSFVRYLDVMFDEASGPLQELVNSVANNPDFSAEQRIRLYQSNLNGDPATRVPVSLQRTLSIIDHVIEVDFGSGGVGGNSNTTAADGYYELDVLLPNGQISVHHFERLLGDINGDGIVDGADLGAITARVGQAAPVGMMALSADVNGDEVVTSLDLALAVRSKGRRMRTGLSVG